MLTTILLSGAIQAAAAVPAGHYTVPVSPELRPYADFELDCALLREGDDKKLHLEYNLPLELTDAKSRHIVLEETARDGHFITMRGADGHGACFNGTDHFSCIVDYSTIKIDADAVQAYVDRLYPEPVEHDFRAKVARAFGGEPAGIIELPKLQDAGTIYTYP